VPFPEFALPLAVLAAGERVHRPRGKDALNLGGVDHLAVILQEEMVFEVYQRLFQRLYTIGLCPDFDAGLGSDADQIF
jgi:hypothetical protein